ncbi:GNAT family N-acetyltransferase [soil metagenome]
MRDQATILHDGKGAEVSVQPLRPDLLSDAVDVLSRSFSDNPNFKDLFPDDKVRVQSLPHVQHACVLDAFRSGYVHAAIQDNKVLGTAVWLPSGAFPLSPLRQLRTAPDMFRIMARSPRSLPRLICFASAMAELHPTQPYWYLEVIGVDPAAQGMGIGARLLKHGIALADEAGQACYLETMTERNVAWYEEFGFEARKSEVSFVPNGPPNWTMLRRPSRSPSLQNGEDSIVTGDNL